MSQEDNGEAFVRIEKAGINAYVHHPQYSTHQQANTTGFWSLDLIVRTTAPAYIATKGWRPPGLDLNHADSPPTRFLSSSLDMLKNELTVATVAFRFLFPSTSGSVVRSDFLEQRLEHCQHVLEMKSFLTPLQHVSAVHHEPVTPYTLGKTLSKAIGAVRLHPSATFKDLDVSLDNRISFSWLLSTPLHPRRIAWVQGREDIDSIQHALQAAVALGIKLVIMDEPGHWLQKPNSTWAHFREAFVEVNIIPDAGFPQRVADAVRAYPKPIDGIITISDVRLPGVAMACQILGLPTESPEAYEIAGDKGRTRMLEPVGANESFVLSGAHEVHSFLEKRQQENQRPFEFPLVVKPAIGWSSDCVSKVYDRPELVDAIHKASDRHASSPKRSTAVVVEPYVDGPEVDANFALLEGEILFFEVSDDFPSPADVAGPGSRANFQETQNVLPSALPQAEISIIRDEIRASILRQGFRTGVFHCEARVRNSHVAYGAQKDGVIDLMQKPPPLISKRLEVYLHEINARPPGYLESVAVLLTYGVDYYALRMLMAIGPSESDRLRALVQPFHNGPQFHLSIMIIQQTRAGVMKTADAAKEFLEKYPELRENVVDYYSRKKAGDILEGPDASALWWLAYFSVVSRISRSDLLERVDYIQTNFSYDMEGENSN